MAKDKPRDESRMPESVEKDNSAIRIAQVEASQALSQAKHIKAIAEDAVKALSTAGYYLRRAGGTGRCPEGCNKELVRLTGKEARGFMNEGDTDDRPTALVEYCPECFWWTAHSALESDEE